MPVTVNAVASLPRAKLIAPKVSRKRFSGQELRAQIHAEAHAPVRGHDGPDSEADEALDGVARMGRRFLEERLA